MSDPDPPSQNYKPPTNVRKILDGFTIGEYIFCIEVVQPKEASIAMIGEIIATDDRVAIKRLWLEHKVDLLHVKLETLMLDNALEFIQQALHVIFNVPACFFITDIHFCERSLRVVAPAQIVDLK